MTGRGWQTLRRRAGVVVGLCVAAAGLATLAQPPAFAAVNPKCASLPASKSIAAGNTDAYALNANGGVWSWGDNYYGQMGNGSTANALVPLNASGFSSVQAVTAGEAHVLVLRQDGTVWAWGDDSSGQLGDGRSGASVQSLAPVQVPGLTNVVSVDAGGVDGHSSFAIKGDGTVWAWGSNNNGQLGDGTLIDRAVPVQIPALTGFAAIGGSAFYSLGLKPDGSVWGWGLNLEGQLGTNVALGATQQTPVQVAGLSGVTAISAGNYHATALKSDGTVWSLGYGAFGELGNGTYNDSSSPVQATGVSGITQIAAGGFFTLALNATGAAYAWGDNSMGQMGIGTTLAQSATPTQIPSLSSVAELGAGEYNGVALTSDGRVWDWGDNSSGQIGNGTASSSSPQRSPYQTSVVQAAAAAPTNLQAVAGNGVAYLTWNAPSSAVTQYVVTPYLNGVAQPQVAAPVTAPPQGAPPGTTSAYTVSGLTTGGNYTFTVAGQNCLGTGAATAQSSAVIPTGVLGQTTGAAETSRVTDRMSLNVNTFSGNLSVAERDIAIKGTGVDLSIDRVYNNKAATASIFGRNWTTNSNTSLGVLGDGSALWDGPDGSQVGFAKNGDGTFAPPSGVDATLVKNGDGSFKLTNNAASDTWSFTAAGVLTSHADRNGNALTYAHGGPGGAISSITDTQGRVVTFAYNASSLVASVTDSIGRVSSYGYDASQHLTTHTDAANGVTTFTYDANHNLTQITTPAGRVVTIGYDASQRASSIGHPNQSGNPTTSFSYNSATTVVTDASGHTTTYTYDPVGRATNVTDALGNQTNSTYTSNSNIATYATGNGSAGGTLTYDSRNNLNSAAVAPGAHSTLGYTDPNHPFSPTTITDPQNNTTSLTYDAKGNPLTATNPLPSQNQIQLTYNANGTVATSKDPDLHQTSYGYDPKGNLTSVTPPAPLGAQSRINDALSRPTTVTDGKGQATTYAYDALDRVTLITYSDAKTVRYTYDGDGNQTTMVDGTGTTTMTYDAMGRLVSRVTPDGKTVSYTYDGVGNLLTLADPGGTTTYTYNAANLPTRVTDPAGHIINLGYDANYNRTSVSYPNGQTVYSTYDAANRLVRVNTVDGHLNDNYSYTPSTPSHASAQAITMRGAPVTYASAGTTTTSVTLAAPAGLKPGDVEIAQIASSAIAAMSSVPTGWTLARADATGATVTDVRQSVYWHVAGTSEPTVYAWGLGQATYAAGGLTSWSGVDPAAPIASSTGQVATGAGTSWTAPSLAFQNGELDVVLYGGRPTGAAGTLSVPTGYSAAYDTQSAGVTTGLDAKAMAPTAGSSGAQGAVGPSAWWVGQQVLLRPVYNTSLLQSTPDGSKSYDALNRLTTSASGYSYTYDGASNRLSQSTTDATVSAWGYNANGQLGNATTVDSRIPTQTTNFTSIAAGWYHSVGLKSDGTVWGWGSNGYGQLGNNSTISSTSPVKVSGLTGVTKIAAGNNFSLALKSDGTVWAWGYNANGQLGNNSNANSLVPVQVSGLTATTAIAAGGYHALALKSGGAVWAWGLNNVGQLGNNTTAEAHAPVQSWASNVTGIAAGYAHSVVVQSNGTAWGWGLNSSGQLGNGTTNNALTAVQVSGITTATTVAAGYGHSLARLSDGSVRAWGSGINGELGRGTTASSTTAIQVPGLTAVSGVAAASSAHSLALKTDGSVWAWGYNPYGQVGNNSTANALSAVQVPGLRGITSIAAGLDHSFGLFGGNQSVAATYNGANELSTAGTRTFSHDGNGNLTGTNDGGAATYDTANRATAFTPPGGSASSFTYRGAGQTERATMSPATRINASCPNIAGCTPTITSLGSSATFENSRLGVSAETDGGSTTYFVRDPRGGLLAEVVPGGAAYYYIFDGQGSIVGLTDTSGGWAATYGYDPYGQLTSMYSSGSVGINNPWRYVGAYQDGTGLYHMGERYYDTTTGRFTQQDPLTNALDAKSWNRYTYVGGDPVDFTDSSGLNWLSDRLQDFSDGWHQYWSDVRTGLCGDNAVTKLAGAFGVLPPYTLQYGAGADVGALAGLTAKLAVNTGAKGAEIYVGFSASLGAVTIVATGVQAARQFLC